MDIDLPAPSQNQRMVTVLINTSRDAADGDYQVANRWADLRRSLQEQSAPAEVLDQLQERVLEPTGAAGPHGRLLLADPQSGVLVDRVLHEPPRKDDAVWAAGPNTFAFARTADSRVRYLLVAADRTGAELEFVDTASSGSTTESIEGEHNEITKNRMGGLSHRRIQARAEDSWERNSEQIAEEIDSAARQFEPELVVLTGDVRMVTLIGEMASGSIAGLLHPLPGGARSDSADDDSFEQDLQAALDQFRLRRRQETIDRFAEATGRDSGAVTGLADVLEALRRGQVAEVLVTPDAVGAASRMREQTLWHGPDALQVALDAEGMSEMGVTDPGQGPADVVLGLAAWGSGAGVALVDEEAVELTDGIGALLRWDDDSTPGQTAYKLSDDTPRT